jgi:leucine dehydrogenase
MKTFFTKQLAQIKRLPEFDNHSSVNFVEDEATGLKGFIAIHRGNHRYPAFGATRFWYYQDETSALKEALRLSRTMSYKAALAGLPYGGAKAVLVRPQKRHLKKDILTSYAQKVAFLGGRFITGADVGISKANVREMKKKCPFMVGIKADPVESLGL